MNSVLFVEGNYPEIIYTWCPGVFEISVFSAVHAKNYITSKMSVFERRPLPRGVFEIQIK